MRSLRYKISRPKYISSGPKLFHFWVNTFFIDQQRSSSLTHSSPGSSQAPAQTWQQLEDRNCRSTHNSGGTLGPDSPLPPPRALRHTLSSGDSRTSDPASQGSSEDQVSQSSSFLSDASTFNLHTLSYLVRLTPLRSLAFPSRCW